MRDAAQDVRLSPRAIALARTRAGELSAELRLLGFATVVHATKEHRRQPCVEVRSGPVQRVHGRDFVYAAPDDLCDEGGSWSFWHSSMQRMAALGEVSAAAKEAVRLAACPGDGCAGCAQAAEQEKEMAHAC